MSLQRHEPYKELCNDLHTRVMHEIVSQVVKKPLLAGTLKDLEKLKFPCLATPKIDGIRALRVNNDMISRQFKQIRNQTMRRILTDLLPEGSDGEIMVSGTFQDVTSCVMSASGSESFDRPFTFYWFDYVKDDPQKPYVSRIEDMRLYIGEHPEVLLHKQAKIIPLYPVTLSDVTAVTSFEEKALRDGFEGVMIRKPGGCYKMGRSSVPEGILLKLKRFSDAEGTVTGYQELQHNLNDKVVDDMGSSKRSHKISGMVAGGKLGALKVTTTDGVAFNIGSGFTDKQRIELWNEKETLKGRLVKYKYFETGSKNAPRFPTFLGFRHADDL